MSDQVVPAAQAALAAEHAAVYGYGVVGGQLTGEKKAQARAALAAHRARRDQLVRTVQGLKAKPAAAAAAYRLPFAVTDQASAVRLAARLETRVADVYGDLIVASGGALRASAAAALREAALRAVQWTGTSTAFPGITL
ncbi:hypothetical protein BIV57_21895 [Mangrovactinospora gilvigrisea]|uniref:DUF4439 domain-containing protein n=1 Tax=Mangrovactinospora gilvigrisea TaxID=1428644 RepID=A0A1J7B9N3_9ACTN|nr:DUF4439 domain-containing protein [Mangrovactinospora gilvigrisea]OIV35383.1 hypothetical protein BIV57_21895 [Mangrovactinospora gilvigrisea]